MSDTKYEPPFEELTFEFDGQLEGVEELILAKLLIDGVLFCNNAKSPGGDQTICAIVNCSDVFAWGCADAESVTISEILSLYEMHIDPLNGNWGSSKWCCIKRNQRPQKPVIKAMKAAGVWCTRMRALPK